MKIGDYATTGEILNSSIKGWVGLVSLRRDGNGGILGGIVAVIEATKGKAGDALRSAKREKNTDGLLVMGGGLSGVSVGEVFVK